jgi:hypothetical protein
MVDTGAEPTATLPLSVTVSPDVLYQTIEGHAVLLDLAGERYYSLDDVGTRIWQLLAEQSDVSTVLERLLDVYEIDRASLTRDLTAFFDRLASAGLVRVEPGKQLD